MRDRRRMGHRGSLVSPDLVLLEEPGHPLGLARG